MTVSETIAQFVHQLRHEDIPSNVRERVKDLMLDCVGIAFASTRFEYAGKALAGTPVDVVFVGSCTNGRLSDMREVAQVLRGRRVADRVRMLVVPGSEIVKREAEAAGLDRVFSEAGFEWRDFTPDKLEYYGQFNFLKAALVYGDKLSTDERWAVVAYVRALQRAHHATIDDAQPTHSGARPLLAHVLCAE